MDAELIESILILSGIALIFPVTVGLYYRLTGMIERRKRPREQPVCEQCIDRGIDYDLLAEKIVDELVRRGGLRNYVTENWQ